MTRRITSDGLMTLAGAGVILAVLAAITGSAMVVLGGEPMRQRAVVFAAMVTGAAALFGWSVSRWSRGRGPALGVAGGLGATLARMAPMLAALGWVYAQDGDLRAARAPELLIAFYLPLLATDIILTLLASPRGPRNGGADAAN